MNKEANNMYSVLLLVILSSLLYLTTWDFVYYTLTALIALVGIIICFKEVRL